MWMKKQQEDKYDAIDRKYRSYIYRIAYSKLHNKEDSEEATQDALLKIWKLTDRIGEDEEKNRAFIAKIAKYTAIDYYRKTHSQKYTRLIFDECDLISTSAENTVIKNLTSKQFIEDLLKVDSLGRAHIAYEVRGESVS